MRFPHVPNDDPRHPTVQSILAKHGGAPPLPPLPLGWEGSRPTCYDGTLHGLVEYLHWGLFAEADDDDYPRAGPIFHYNRVLRNAHRLLHALGICDLLDGLPKAVNVCDGMGQIHGLLDFVRMKIAESQQVAEPQDAEPARVPDVMRIPGWGRLGIGIHAKQNELQYIGFSPCPSLGANVNLNDGILLPLRGRQWSRVLPCFTRSVDGRTARIDDLVLELGFFRKVMHDHEQDEYEAKSSQATTAYKKLRNAMADLGRKLREVVRIDRADAVFQRSGDEYRAAFTAAHILRDEKQHFTFGKAD